jgi:outer membrane protein TolC
MNRSELPETRAEKAPSLSRLGSDSQQMAATVPSVRSSIREVFCALISVIPAWAIALLMVSCAAYPSWGQDVPAEALSLQDAIALATTANPEASIAVAREREAKAGLQSARSALLPRVGASETFTDSTDPIFAFGARLRQGRFTSTDFSPDRLNYPPATSDFMSTVGATWMLFDSGRTIHQIRGARDTSASMEQQAKSTRQDLAYQAIRAYYRALLSDQEKLTMAAAVARARSFSKETHDRVNTGMALPAEGMQADVDVSQREQDAAEAQSNALLAYSDLAGVLGDSSKQFTLATPVGTPAPLTSSIGALQSLALKLRPNLAAARSKVVAAGEALRASHSAYGPQFSTFANVQADNPHLTGGGNTNWTVGAKVEIQLFDGGERRSQVSQSSAEREIAEASYRQAETQASLQVKQAYYAVQTAQRQYGTSEEMLVKARETLRTSTDRYDAGLVTVTEVLSEQEQLRSIELNRVESLYRWWIAAAQLRLATGEGYSTQTGTQP